MDTGCNCQFGAAVVVAASADRRLDRDHRLRAIGNSSYKWRISKRFGAACSVICWPERIAGTRLFEWMVRRRWWTSSLWQVIILAKVKRLCFIGLQHTQVIARLPQQSTTNPGVIERGKSRGWGSSSFVGCARPNCTISRCHLRRLDVGCLRGLPGVALFCWVLLNRAQNCIRAGSWIPGSSRGTSCVVHVPYSFQSQILSPAGPGCLALVVLRSRGWLSERACRNRFRSSRSA